MALSSHDYVARVLLIARKEGSFVEMNETQALAATIYLALLSIKRLHIVVFGKELCDTGVATACEDTSVLDESERLHVTGNGIRLALENLHTLLQTGRHVIVHDA